MPIAAMPATRIQRGKRQAETIPLMNPASLELRAARMRCMS
jgi:hypothetical protein